MSGAVTQPEPKPKDVRSLVSMVKKGKYSQAKGKSRSKRAATARKDRLWDYGIIPYDIEANFTGALTLYLSLGVGLLTWCVEVYGCNCSHRCRSGIVYMVCIGVWV